MARKNYSFHHIIALCWLYFFSIHCQEANQAESKLIIGSDVETISTGWPIHDYEDQINSLKSQFYYQSGQNSSRFDYGFSKEFVDQVKNKSSTFKLSFKVWIYNQKLNQDPYVGVTTVGELHDYTRNIIEYYKNYYYGDWMPLEIVFSAQDLDKFDMLSTLLYNNNLIAYKDIKFDYEKTKTTQSLITPYDSHSDTIKGWRKYISPPRETGNPPYDFIYFINDPSFVSEINFSNFTLDYKLAENETIAECIMQFTYYIKRVNASDESEAKITVSGIRTGTDPTSQPNTASESSPGVWHSLTPTFKDLTSLRLAKIMITVKKEKKISDLTFVAIKNLDVVVKVINSYNLSEHTYPVHCNKTSCFNANTKLMWDNHRSYLDDEVAYYYPVSDDNALTIVNDLTDGTHNDVHYALEYIDKAGSIISVNHTTVGDTESNTILKVKSKPSVIATDPFNKDTSFTLSDLVAINSKISFITLSVNQQNSKGIDSFLVKVIPTGKTTVFTNYKQNFLQQWNADNIPSPLRNISWKDEWKTIPNTEIFRFSQEDVVFQVDTESRIPASAQLISKWIRYDKALIKPYPRYNVKVNTNKMFNAFTLRPKVCDSLMRCEHVILLNETYVKGNQSDRDYVFKFSEMKTDYIKLVFSIEYFVPPTEPIGTPQPPYPVKFNLRLLHFGDPCDGEVKCAYNGDCVVDPETDPPNELKCSCGGIHADDCSGIDYCKNHTTPTNSGKNRCDGIYHSGCDHLAYGFRCQCLETDVNSRIIFAPNLESTDYCFPVKDSHSKPNTKNWKILTENTNTYYPIASDNQLELKFEQISSENVDIKVKIDYKNKEENKNLLVIYSKNNSIDRPVIVDTWLTTGSDTIEFNLRDYVYNYAENFSLLIQIKASSSGWDSDNFTLIHTISAVKRIKTEPLGYGHNWLFANGDQPSNEWKVKYPDHGFVSPLVTKSSSDPKFTINFQLDHNPKIRKSQFMSEWMHGSTLFTGSFNTFSVKFRKIANIGSAKNYVQNINRKLYISENDKLTVTSAPISLLASKDAGDYIAYENIPIQISVGNNSVFKIALEIDNYLPESITQPLDIIFYAFSVGDSCYTNNKLVCGEDRTTLKCEATGPQQFNCKCKNDSLAGQLCEETNHCKDKYNEEIKSNEDYCNQLPSLSDVTDTRCFSILQRFICDCPNYGYTWDNNKCKRISYEKVTVGCDGKSCDPFASIKTDLKFSNKNLPDIPKGDPNVLPFYYLKPDKSLTLSINKLNVSANDACFELNYFSTANAKIDINYNAANVLTLASSATIKNEIEDTDWKPILDTNTEKLCAKSFASDGSTSFNFNVSFVSKYANTDTDIVAIKLKEFTSDKYVDFPDKMTHTVSAPFITYLSHSIENYTYDESFENQWPLRVPHNSWKPCRKEENVLSPGFVKYTDIISFTDKLTAAPKSAYLLSKWIAKYTEGSVLSFYVSTENTEHFTIRAILVDKDYKEQSNTLIALDSKATINRISIPVNSISTAFRLKFKVDYQRPSYDASQKNVSFALVNIALGDPCVNADINEFNLCTGHGHCNRTEDYKKSVCVCEKQNGIVWFGERCSMQDYCNMAIPPAAELSKYKNGTEFCESEHYGTCINVETTRKDINFQCSCQKDVTYWNRNNISCSPTPKCLSHTCPDPLSQECREPDLSKNETVRCMCKEGYVAVADGADDKALKCERFDPCIVLHQNITEQIKTGHPLPPDYPLLCNTPLASCIAIETIPFNVSVNRDYYCVCPANFETKNEKTGTECDPLFCDLPLNQCKQNCIKLQEPPYYNCTCFSNDTYIKDGNDCKFRENKTCECKGTGFCVNSNTDCQCRVGYYYDTSSNDCVFQQSTTSDRLCKNGKLNATDGVVKCDCIDGYELNKNLTCDYISPCANSQCDKSAVCVININDIHKYKCQCPEGTMFDDGSILANTNSTCLPVCSAQERNKRCREKNAICNPFKVYSKESIRQNPDDLAAYCECRTGYVNFNQTEGCRLGQYSIGFRFLIKNTFDSSVNKNIEPEQQYFASQRQKRETMKTEYELKDRLLISFTLKQQEELLNRSNAENRGAIDQQTFIDALRAQVYDVLNHTGFNVITGISVDRCAPTANNEYINCTFVVVTNAENKNKNLAELLAKDCQVVGDNCFFHEIGDGHQTFVIRNDSLSQTDLGKLFEHCSVQQRAISCPDYTTCEPSKTNDSYYSCTCNSDYFNVSHTDFIKTEQSADERKFPIEQCKVNTNQCEKCPSRQRSDNPKGKCVQEAPVLDPTDHLWKSEMRYCGCEDGFWKENNQSTQCNAACSLDCGSNGQCRVKASVGYCLCNDGWSGERCGDEHKASVGGWIAGIVVLAVLVVVVAIVALIFARRSRGGDTSSAHAMDEYSHTSYRVGQQSSATARSQPSAPIVHASSGRDNKGFSRD